VSNVKLTFFQDKKDGTFKIAQPLPTVCTLYNDCAYMYSLTTKERKNGAKLPQEKLPSPQPHTNKKTVDNAYEKLTRDSLYIKGTVQRDGSGRN